MFQAWEWALTLLLFLFSLIMIMFSAGQIQITQVMAIHKNVIPSYAIVHILDQVQDAADHN